jgi:ribosomal protein S12 methylthiotransferase accessory factor
MKLDITYLNEWIELFDGVYDEERARELGAAVQLYNRLIGPVTSAHIVRPELRDLSMYSAYCRHTPLPWLIRDVRLKVRPIEAPVPGGGKGIPMVRSVIGALGEMAERLLAMLHFTSLAETLRFGSYTDLVRAGHRAAGPRDIPLFAAEQYASANFKFQPFEADTWLGWVEGTELLTGESIWVPAQLVLMYYRPAAGEPSIGYATTAGLAFQTSVRAAMLHGLFEVIERDALNVRWYSRLVPAKVDVNLTKVLAAGLNVPRARMTTPDLDVNIFELTLDSPIPVLAAIGIDRAKQERAFLGGTGAAANRTEALAQALFELGQCQTGFHFEDPFGRNPIYHDADLSEVIEFFDAPLYYGHIGNLPRTYWFSGTAELVPWEAVRSIGADDVTVYGLVDSWLRGRGLNPILIDFSDACPPGMSITKVYVPELSHACPPRDPMLGHPRFYEIPRSLGFNDHRLSFGELSTDPIPFA